jgi:hypothetical protein
MSKRCMRDHALWTLSIMPVRVLFELHRDCGTVATDTSANFDGSTEAMALSEMSSRKTGNARQRLLALATEKVH